MGFKLKPVNRKLADVFHRESEEGVEAVLARMKVVAGDKAGFSYGEMLDVSENTIKTWRRRGAVSTKFLEGFAREHGTSLDYLLYGEARADAGDGPISTDERYLIKCYRDAPKALRDAALRVLLGGDAPSSGLVQKIKSNKGQMTQSGQIVNVGRSRGK